MKWCLNYILIGILLFSYCYLSILCFATPAEKVTSPSLIAKLDTQRSAFSTQITSAREEELSQQVVIFEFHPPLSINEAIKLLYRLIRTLNNPATQEGVLPQEKILEVIQVVSDYVKLVDDRNSSLASYRWYEVGEKKIPSPVADKIYELRLNVFPILRNVSAVSFVVSGGDIFIQALTVIDERNNETKFVVNRWIKDNFPRKEVCFLYFPTSLKQIIISCSVSSASSNIPRLKFYGGRTNVPEYGKAALYYLTRAQHSVLDNAESNIIISDLHNAIDYLIRFKSSRNL